MLTQIQPTRLLYGLGSLSFNLQPNPNPVFCSGAEYTFSFWAFAENTPVSFGFYSFMTPGDANSFFPYAKQTIPFGAWTQLDWTFTVPMAYTGAQLWIGTYNSGAEEFYVYVDDFALTSQATNC